MTTEYRTWVRDHQPGSPIPPDLIRLGATPEETLAAVELRARQLVRQIVGEYRTARRWHFDPDGWALIARQAAARHRTELRTVLRDRRAIRAQVEREQDRVEAAFKEAYGDEPLAVYQAEGR